MKELDFIGDSHDCLMKFPKEIIREIGFQLDKVQRGDKPASFKTIKQIGPGVEEVRVQDAVGWYRAIYCTKKDSEYVYVLHCLKKKTNQTPKKDIDVAKERFKNL